MASYVKYKEWSPRLMRDLLDEFPAWGPLDAAACVGNGGHESGGFTLMQELKPVVPGSRGGLGGFQWTGPRRRKYEAWCLTNALNPHSYDATKGFLIGELRGPEKAAVAKTAKAETLDDKVVAFEKAFERAGVKHYPSRQKYAAIALNAYQGPGVAPPLPQTSGSVISVAPITDPHQISLVQGYLKNLGYPPGGNDGVVGPLTKDAIRAFRKENHMPPGDHIDEALILALVNAKKKRELAPERTQATPADVRNQIPETEQTWKSKIAAQVSAIVGAVGAFFSGILGNIGAAKDYIDPVKEYFASIPGWGWFLIVAAISAGIWWMTRSAEQKQVVAYREGERL